MFASPETLALLMAIVACAAVALGGLAWWMHAAGTHRGRTWRDNNHVVR